MSATVTRTWSVHDALIEKICDKECAGGIAAHEQVLAPHYGGRERRGQREAGAHGLHLVALHLEEADAPIHQSECKLLARPCSTVRPRRACLNYTRAPFSSPTHHSSVVISTNGSSVRIRLRVSRFHNSGVL